VRQGLLRMFGPGADQLQQPHALVSQLGEALAARVELAPPFGKTRGKARGGLVERTAGFAALRGDARHVRRQRAQPLGERIAALGQARDVGEMLLLPLGHGLVERGDAGIERGRGLLLALLGLGAALGDAFLERLGALDHYLVDPFGLFGQRGEPAAGVVERVAVDLGDLLDREAQPLLQLVDRLAPPAGRVFLVLGKI